MQATFTAGDGTAAHLEFSSGRERVRAVLEALDVVGREL
jgi:hypothetical protein